MGFSILKLIPSIIVGIGCKWKDYQLMKMLFVMVGGIRDDLINKNG